ncbi:MAG: serine acetyltransferase [Candidatus Omnitrophota bacterium]
MLTQLRYLAADMSRRDHKSPKSVFYDLFDGSMWAVIFYRLSRALFLVNVPILKYLSRFSGFIVFKLSEILFGVSLPPSVEIGPGLFIGHTGLLVFHHEVKAGMNLSVSHGVTIGVSGLGKKGAPEIGHNVYVGAGAKILGNIKVGDHCRVGANAVVVRDLPCGCTAVGVPAKVILP